MGITVTGKLNKSANTFQAGESTGFGVRLGVKFYNRETKADEWCNYEAVIFAKSPGQIGFYQSALIEGSVIEVSGSGCQIKTFNGNNGPVNSIAILDAKLGYVHTGQQQAPRQQQAQAQAPQQGYQQPAPQQHQGGFQQAQQGYQQQQAPKVNPQEPVMDFDDEIPF